MSEIACPRCKSEHTASRRMIHEQGVTNFAAFNVGSNGNFSTTSGVGATEFSKRHEPPVPPMVGLYLTILILGMVLGIPFLVIAYRTMDNMAVFAFLVLIWLVLTLWMLAGFIKDARYSSSGKYAEDVRKYDSSFVCLKCGHIFQVDL